MENKKYSSINPHSFYYVGFYKPKICTSNHTLFYDQELIMRADTWEITEDDFDLEKIADYIFFIISYLHFINYFY